MFHTSQIFFLSDEDLVQDTSCIVRKIKVGNSKVHYLKQGSKDMLWVKYQDNSQILIDGCNIFPVKYKFSDGETNALVFFFLNFLIKYF